MTIARVLIRLPAPTRMTAFEADLAALAAKYGLSLERSASLGTPIDYEMKPRYVNPHPNVARLADRQRSNTHFFPNNTSPTAA